MKPILFSTPMVEAILDSCKSMTRRVITDLPEGVYRTDTDNSLTWGAYYGRTTDEYHATCCKEIKPKYLPGDVLWVRETFCLGKVECGENPDGSDGWYIEPDEDGGIIPKQWAISHNIGVDDIKWKPSIFMPKEFARIFLRVKRVWAERVQDITQAGAIDEGALLYDGWETPEYQRACTAAYADGTKPPLGFSPRERFEHLWNKLNKARGFGWDKNPWVWVYEFERIERPEEMA